MTAERTVAPAPGPAAPPGGEPYLRVVAGRLAAAEIAALVAVLLGRDRDAAPAAAAGPCPPPRSNWGARIAPWIST